MSGNTSAAPGWIVTQTMVLADNLVASNMSKAERSASVKTDVLGGSERTVGETIDDDPLVEQSGRIGFSSHFVRESDGIPEWSERAPIRLGEGAFAGENRLHLSLR